MLPNNNEDELVYKLNGVREQLASAQKMLGERNIKAMQLLRLLDAIPGDSELNQYQRRFTELCAQGLKDHMLILISMTNYLYDYLNVIVDS